MIKCKLCKLEQEMGGCLFDFYCFWVTFELLSAFAFLTKYKEGQLQSMNEIIINGYEIDRRRR